MKIRWETSPEPTAPEYYSTATTAVGGCCREVVEGPRVKRRGAAPCTNSYRLLSVV